MSKRDTTSLVLPLSGVGCWCVRMEEAPGQLGRSRINSTVNLFYPFTFGFLLCKIKELG